MNRRTVSLLVALMFGFGLRDVAAQPAAADYMELGEDFSIDGGLPDNALLISLQGVVNKNGPQLYFVYPSHWQFSFSKPVLDYYRDTREIRFAKIDDVSSALERYADQVSKYVVWDRKVRTSLIVAFTVSGLEDAVVVTDQHVPMLQRLGMTQVADFRGRFDGWSDYEIYRWAYDEFWQRCSRDFVIWMGGVGRDVMQPGVADWGIYNGSFFTDLSANPVDTLELQLHNRILSEMKSTGFVFGWHSYVKDTEAQHVSLISSYGLRMEGLNSLPNASFSHQIPTTPGYTFRNNHNVAPDETIVPENKVYLTAIQTDALGIGAWLKPGRGSMPYAWEVTMNWSWLFPAQMQFFYDTATPNDYFVGALSGPGYMYPKPIPPDKHRSLVAEAEVLMKTLDLRVFEVMDYSEGNRYVGNIDLTRDVVERYFEGMPDAIGFINGYGPAHTYEVREGRALVSYDYYLSPTRPEEDAVLDLRELITMNTVRPYYLAMHVRESSDIDRVKRILDQLGDDVEVVPLDVFLRMAGQKPTMRRNYR